MQRRILILFIFFSTLIAGRSACAAEVTFNVQPRETYIGVPVTLTISIEGSTKIEAPVLPELEDFTLLGPPSRNESSFTTIVNASTVGARAV
jgi:hypothetical protein